MVRLGAGDSVLSVFEPLKREDLRSSTALLNPNMLGSSQLQLLWIWQDHSAGRCETPEAMKECRSDPSTLSASIDSFCSSACTLVEGLGTEVLVG